MDTVTKTFEPRNLMNSAGRVVFVYYEDQEKKKNTAVFKTTVQLRVCDDGIPRCIVDLAVSFHME